MSLTSYRAAPPRVTMIEAARGSKITRNTKAAARNHPAAAFAKIVNGFFRFPPAIMPGDDLLFRGLSHSTIGAAWFHGRVRDGIGWGTGAMVTKQ